MVLIGGDSAKEVTKTSTGHGLSEQPVAGRSILDVLHTDFFIPVLHWILFIISIEFTSSFR